MKEQCRLKNGGVAWPKGRHVLLAKDSVLVHVTKGVSVTKGAMFSGFAGLDLVASCASTCNMPTPHGILMFVGFARATP